MTELEKRVKRLEKMFEKIKDGKQFWIPYSKKKPIKEEPKQKASEK